MNKLIKYFLIFALANLVFKLFLSQYFTSYSDLLTYRAWGISLSDHGFSNFYQNIWSDYLPGYLYTLWGVTEINMWLQSLKIHIPNEIIYKLPSILADIGSSYFVLKIIQKFSSSKNALIYSIIYLFNLALFANSTLWGQSDSFITLFLISSLYYLLAGKYWLSAILIGIGQTIKPIAVFSIPLYLIYMYLKKQNFKSIIIYTIVIIITVILLFIPFTNNLNIFQFILDRHLVTSNQYPYTTLHAINFWSIIHPFWTSDLSSFLNITYHIWGFILFGAIYLGLMFTMLLSKKRDVNLSLLTSFTMALCYLSMFLFLTRMHERHMFYGLALSMLIFPIISKFSSLVLSLLYLIYLFSLYYALSQLNQNPLIVERNFVEIISFISLIIFGYLLIIFLKKYGKTTHP